MEFYGNYTHALDNGYAGTILARICTLPYAALGSIIANASDADTTYLLCLSACVRVLSKEMVTKILSYFHLPGQGNVLVSTRILASV